MRAPPAPGTIRCVAALCLTAVLLPLSTRDAAASAAIWADRCSGCHSAAPSGARANAAGATAAFFTTVFGNVSAMEDFNKLPIFGGLSDANKVSLGAYIEAVINTTPITTTTPYDTTKTVSLANKFVRNTAASGLDTFRINTAPSKGTLSYTSATNSLVYNPTACRTGADTMTYRFTDGGSLTTATRSLTVTIGSFPVPVISSATTHAGTFGSAISPYTIASSAFPCPADTTWGATGLPPGITRTGNQLTGTPTVPGTYIVTLTATNTGGTDNETLTFTVNRAAQTIAFPLQPAALFTLSPVAINQATGGASGMPIVYSSGSPLVCSVNNVARTYTPITAGPCVINANQAGNTNYNAASQVFQTAQISAVAPAAPTIGSASPGVSSATVTFTPPTSNGGSAITSYTASCSATLQTTRTATGAGSPLVVGSLANGIQYSCTVRATNAAGSSPQSGAATVTALDPAQDEDNDGVPNGVEGPEGLNPFVKDNDVFASARLFAMQQYRDFLGREGDPGGITFYTDLLESGTATRVQVVDSFLASPEFQNGLPSVIRLYFSFFSRIPDYGGLNFQVTAFRQGTPLDVIAQNFYNSPEFTNRYGALSNDQYINLVYQNVLGRAPDPGGYDFYKTRLDSGVLTKGQMMIGFSESAEFQQITSNEVFVVSVYTGLLRRTPEPGGLDFYVDLLDSGTPRSDILPGFLNSPEYRARFLP